jgi:hypothetical protein
MSQDPVFLLRHHTLDLFPLVVITEDSTRQYGLRGPLFCLQVYEHGEYK